MIEKIWDSMAAAEADWDITCDRCDRRVIVSGTSRNVARDAAEERGWHYDGDDDLCPSCNGTRKSGAGVEP